jgi:hypothetical protein
MVTNQIIKRPMGVFVVEQRTKDGMFNATALMKDWNKTNPDEKRDIDNFWKSTNLTELMSEIAENELGFKSVVFTDLKKVLSVTTRGKYNGGTWMNPILFLKFAMYLSPRFEYHVLKFVSDQMIKFRKDAGDAYKDLSAAVSTLVQKNEMQAAISRVSKGVNVIVFGEHYPAIRNDKGEEALQFELFEMERKLAELINDGFIKSYDELIRYMLKKYYEKYTPNIFK